MAALAVIGLAGAAGEASADERDTLLAQRIEAHINFLADDLLRGRQPGTEGYDIAAAYVTSQFTQIGLQPAGHAGSFLQPVPLRRALQVPGSARFEIGQGDETEALSLPEQFWMSPSLAHELTDLEAGTVFAGHGIHAAEEFCSAAA